MSTNLAINVPDGAEDAYSSLVLERQRQDAKWGVQEHHPAVWLAILAEEMGELATAILRGEEGPGVGETRRTKGMRAEAIQVAAVALAFVECLDRQARWGTESE